MNTLRIFLFNRPRLYWGEASLGRFPTAKSQSLFGYIMLHRDRFHSRDKVATLFWEDSREHAARGALRTELWRLRKYLRVSSCIGAEPLVIDSQEIGFNSEIDYWLDVEEFERGVSEAQSGGNTMSQQAPRHMAASRLQAIERVVELYQGDLLEGCYDDWCIYQRERLQGMFLYALGQLMALYRAAGLHDNAIRCGQRILAIDPLLEQVHRELMSLHCLAGNRPAALRQYRQCERLLERELGVTPMEETAALYLDLIKSDGAALLTQQQKNTNNESLPTPFPIRAQG